MLAQALGPFSFNLTGCLAILTSAMLILALGWAGPRLWLVQQAQPESHFVVAVKCNGYF